MYMFSLIAGTSYLLGSIPFGYLLVRIFRGEDVRQSGSGNIGATNVSRKSPLLGVFTLLLDALKGSAAVALSYEIAYRAGDGPPALEQLALGALFAVLGHMFPVWLRFRGGKGVATGLGAFLLIAPKAVLIAAGAFLTVVLIFRFVSLGSMVAVAIFPFIVWHNDRFYFSTGLAEIFLTSALILVKHKENMRRLLNGTESRMGAKRA
ncbi:MAG: glycerol-3-phosphate 1-O-acyltransferase PlsY [Candidatus Sulfotelmatobacter sp.]